ncbi:hypothetical protein HDZ31DRAFT_38941 [Schizophyllum fasciatum]
MAAASEVVFTRPQPMDVDAPSNKPRLSPLATPTVSDDAEKTPVALADNADDPNRLSLPGKRASETTADDRPSKRASQLSGASGASQPSSPALHRAHASSLSASRPAPPSPRLSRRGSTADRRSSGTASRASRSAAPAPLTSGLHRASSPPPPLIRDYAYPRDDPRHVGTGLAPPSSSAPTDLAEGYVRISGEGERERKRGSGWSSDHSTGDGESKGPWGGDEGWAGLNWMGRLSWQFKNSVANGGAGGSSSSGGASGDPGGGGGGSQGPSRYTDSDGRIDLDRAAALDDDDVITEPDVDSPARFGSRSPHPQEYDEDSQAYDDSRVDGAEDDAPAPAPGIYRAAYSFAAEGPAEMSVRTGQLVRVLGGGGAGWAVAVRGWHPRGQEKERLQRRVQELGLADGDEEEAEEGAEDAGKEDADKEGKDGEHALVPESYLELVRADGDEAEGA